jgi:hypothetical protein
VKKIAQSVAQPVFVEWETTALVCLFCFSVPVDRGAVWETEMNYQFYFFFAKIWLGV